MTPILEQLFRLRLAVARHGEMDRAKWWNANGVLGMRGEAVFRRGFPRTAPFAQARVAFAVARARCSEVFDSRDAVTLWSLPAVFEDQYEGVWQDWLEAPEPWRCFWQEVDQLNGSDLLGNLRQLNLLTETVALVAKQLSIAEGSRSMLLGNCEEINGDVISQLAAAFALGKPGHLVVPYLIFARSPHA